MQTNGFDGNTRTFINWCCPECCLERESHESEHGLYFCLGSEFQSFLASPPQTRAHERGSWRSRVVTREER